MAYPSRVVFKFKSSKKSNNGTDVNAGQLPQLLYRLPSNDTSSSSRKTEQTEPAHILSRDFCRTVTPVYYKFPAHQLIFNDATVFSH